MRNHIPKRVPEWLMLRNHSITVIIFSLVDFKKRLSRRDTDKRLHLSTTQDKRLHLLSRDGDGQREGDGGVLVMVRAPGSRGRGSTGVGVGGTGVGGGDVVAPRSRVREWRRPKRG
jgi:hypothetical protein